MTDSVIDKLTSTDTAAAELSAEHLLQKLINSFDFDNPYLDSYKRNDFELLKYVIDICITILDVSRQILCVVANQVEIESWLLNVLREIYKKAPHSFSSSQINQLKSIAMRTGERIKITTVEPKPNAAGYYFNRESGYLIKRNSIESWAVNQGNCTIGGCFIYTKDFNACLVNHKRYLSQIVDIYNSLDINSMPVKAATLLLNKISIYQKQKLLENFNNFRNQHNLPHAELRETNRKRHRKTHCYSCNEHLESGVYLECSKCGWLVCHCGACGCGYNGRGSSEPFSVSDDEGGYVHDGNSSDLESWTEASDDWVRSDNDGWYYNDDDKKQRVDY